MNKDEVKSFLKNFLDQYMSLVFDSTQNDCFDELFELEWKRRDEP